MIIRFTVVCVICAVLGSLHEASADSRDKLKIHVPQHIRDIHHYHKETIHHHHQHHQYARGYGYGLPSKKPRYHGGYSHNSVYHGGGGRGGRYKSRGGRRRNYGGKRYGMFNYARKYGNWVNTGTPRKHLHGSATYHRPQYARPYRDNAFRRPPAPIEEEVDEQEEDLPPQPPHRDYDEYREDDDNNNNNAHLKQSPAQVGEKIHANINEIIGLISKYSGRREHLAQVRQHGHQKRTGDYQRQTQPESNNKLFSSGHTRQPNQRPAFQEPVSQFTGFDQQNFNNNYNLQSSAPQRNQYNNEQTQAFQSFSYRGRQTEHPQITPQRTIPPPTIIGSIGGGLAFNRFQSGRVDGDHDIGFGQGLEVVQDSSGI